MREMTVCKWYKAGGMTNIFEKKIFKKTKAGLTVEWDEYCKMKLNMEKHEILHLGRKNEGHKWMAEAWLGSSTCKKLSLYYSCWLPVKQDPAVSSSC